MAATTTAHSSTKNHRRSPCFAGQRDPAHCPVIRRLDGTKVYSRKILAWVVTERFAPTNTCKLLLAASKHLVSAGLPLLYADSGVENVNGVVDSVLLDVCLDRILAQVEVAFSNSLIEAYWRSLKQASMAVAEHLGLGGACSGVAS